VTDALLITGGSGFIGRNLVEHYVPQREVFAPRHAELDLSDADAVRAYLGAHPVDTVVHCATKPGHRNAPDPTGLLEANVRMFFNLARCSDLYRKMVFVGSGAVYDMRDYRPKMAETYFDAHVPADDHGFSKYIAAKYIEVSSDVVELRVFGIFGRYEDYAIRFISNAICKALFGLPITLRQDRLFDYLYVDDLPRVVDHFVAHDAAFPAYNVTPDAAIGLYELACKVRDISGADVPIVVGQDGLGVEYSGDNSRLRAEMPELVLTPIDQAIAELFAWYSQHRDSVDRDALLVDK
jgi:UDP-glucose 4-epimerase